MKTGRKSREPHPGRRRRRSTPCSVRLLLGRDTLQPSLIFLAGSDLDFAARTALATGATNTAIDIVYASFQIGEDDVPVLADITVFLPRDRTCFSWRGCVPTMPMGKDRAVLTSPNARGCFSLLPGEIVQRSKQPTQVEQGIARAAARLQELARSDLDVSLQAKVEVHEVA